MSLSASTTRMQSAAPVGLSFSGLALFALFLTMVLRPALFDPDYYWHLETGRWIVANGTLPSGDPFSFTRPGQAWVLHEWLFEVVLYGAFAALGTFGVKLLGAILSATALVIVYATTKKVLGRSRPALWLAAIAYLVLFAYASPRPQLLTYVFVAAYLYILVSFKYAGESRLLPALPIIMIPWVNAHGGYVIGIVLLALFCASEWSVRRFGGRRDSKPGDLRRLALMTLLTILASLCSPYFLAHWAYPFEVMGMAATQQIAEWASPDFHNPLGKLLLLTVGGFAALQIYRAREPDLTELAVPGLFIAAAFSSNRHIVLAVMAMSVFAAPALRDGLRGADWLRQAAARLRRLWQQRAQRGKQLGQVEGILNLAIAGLLVLGTVAYYPTAHRNELDMMREKLPVAATEFILDKGISGRMLNTYHFGGYLIDRLYPQQRVFIDGRADMYGDDFFKEYLTIVRGRPHWAELFDKHDIDYVVIEPDAPLRQLLLLRGDFRLVFQDETSALLVRNTSRFAGIPSIVGQ